jgi:hypothetical protein
MLKQNKAWQIYNVKWGAGGILVIPWNYRVTTYAADSTSPPRDFEIAIGGFPDGMDPSDFKLTVADKMMVPDDLPPPPIEVGQTITTQMRRLQLWNYERYYKQNTERVTTDVTIVDTAEYHGTYDGFDSLLFGGTYSSVEEARQAFIPAYLALYGIIEEDRVGARLIRVITSHTESRTIAYAETEAAGVLFINLGKVRALTYNAGSKTYAETLELRIQTPAQIGRESGEYRMSFETYKGKKKEYPVDNKNTPEWTDEYLVDSKEVHQIGMDGVRLKAYEYVITVKYKELTVEKTETRL